MMRKLYILIALGAMPIISACDLINPPEDIPSYLRVEGYKITVDTIKHGTASGNISDVWVNVGSSFLGAYEMPVTFPARNTGPTKVILTPGVKENGLSSSRSPYPFLKPYEITVDLKEAHIDTLRPEWTYTSNTKFSFIENFEGLEPSIKGTQRNEATVEYLDKADSAFEGKGALKAELKTGQKILALQTAKTYTFPTGTAVWLEINYRNTMPFQVGVFSITPGTGNVSEASVAGLNKHEAWNKMYINLTNTIAARPANLFQIYFAYLLPEGESGGAIYLDNVKLLYLE